MHRLGVGVLGAGRIGALHAQNLGRRIPGVRLVVVADPRQGCAEAAAAASGAQDAVTDARAVLERVDVDAVVVCSPTDTHAELVEAAVASGKHVFCEKPIDHDLARIRTVLDAVHRAGVVFQVGFNRRFDPDFAAIAERVRQGSIGDPNLLRITSRDPAPPSLEYVRHSGGIFLDMSIHDLDMARFLAGEEVVEVFATGSTLVDPAIAQVGDMDTAAITLRFANGALGLIDNSRRAAYGYDQRVEVFGSRGCLLAPNRAPTGVQLWNEQGRHADRPQPFFLERYREAYVAEMRAFVRDVLAMRPASPGGDDGLQAVVLAHAARVSAQENRAVRVEEIAAQAPDAA